MRPVLAIGIVIGALLPAPVHAQIIDVAGQIDLVRPPASVRVGVMSYERLIAFDERPADGATIALDFVGEGFFGNIPSYTYCTESVPGPVMSHYFVRDDMGPAGRKNGFVVFNGRVLGFMTSTECFTPSDSSLGLMTTAYPTGAGGRGMGVSASEGDAVVVLPGGRGVHVRMTNQSGAHESDHLRLVTRPPPGGDANLKLECSGPEDAGVGLVEYVFDLSNEGPDFAALPSVVVLPSAGLTYVSANGGFDCVPETGTRALVCERGDDQALEVRSFRIRFSLAEGETSGLTAIATSDSTDAVPTNNTCTIGGGPLVGTDGGVPGADGGVPGADGGAGDAGTAPTDTGPRPTTGGGAAPSGFTFEGGGGCRCEAAGGPGGRAGGLAAALMVAVLAARRRRRRARA